MAADLQPLLDRVVHRYPSTLIDAVAELEPGVRAVAIKNVTINEDFFPGHYPGQPLMPAVLMIETLTQLAALMWLDRETAPPNARVWLRGVNGARFRRQVVPGDRLRLEVTAGRSRSHLFKVAARALVDSQLVAEAELLLAVDPGAAAIHPSACVHPSATVGAGSTIEANAVIGPEVTIGRNCRIGASAVIGGWTAIGDGTHVFPMASIGMAPQDLKYQGERTRLVIGKDNTFREFVTINRGTKGGGGETRIGDGNLFMAYVHVAHDCRVGDRTIFGPHATLGGHVTVGDFVNVSAGSAVHQFCRVGRHAFIGGYSVVTKDALPFARTIGSRPARIFGVNGIGLSRRGFTADRIAQLKRAYRYLMQSKLNTSRALSAIEEDASLNDPEVTYLLDFIRSSTRGVILRRPSRRSEELVADE